MLRLIDLRAGGPTSLGATLPRAAVDVTSIAHTVEPILEAVRMRGAEAIAEYTEQFDGVRPSSLRVPAEALADAVQMLDPKVRAGLEESIRRARLVHEAQRPVDAPVAVVAGGTVTNRWVPVGRVGLYVPGGRAVYPSSVVMNVVPAQVAGVQSLVLVSPPQPDFGGLPHPVILAAAALLGVEEVYAVGGAQAVAMLAYGLPDEVAPVDLITGPGNIYVTAAKRLVQGTVGIDAEAGPTEIAILADDDADPAYVAADLISQAEHDPLAAAVLITDSERLIAEVDRRLSDQVAATKHVERITESLSGQQSGAVLVRDLEQGLEVVDAYGAEHLQILTREPRVTAARVRNAGAVFVGPFSPVPLGDYCAGSNHVLPTGGTARFASGLSVLAFGRSMQVIEYDQAALAATAEHVTAMAYSEDLPAHAASVQIRAARAEEA